MLAGGINSGPTVYFAIALLSQWFLRTRKPRWFVKYNYILGAGTCPSFIDAVRRRPGLRRPPHSVRCRNQCHGVPLGPRGARYGNKNPLVPKVVGREPQWQLRPMRVHIIVRQRLDRKRSRDEISICINVEDRRCIDLVGMSARVSRYLWLGC